MPNDQTPRPTNDYEDENRRFVYLHGETKRETGQTQYLGIAGQDARHSRVQPMHTTFDLCARRAQFEARLALPNGLLELPHVADANVL